MLTEHQFKLGATFALIGEYEPPTNWLRKLHKQGYEGDGPFYYWLSYSALFYQEENSLLILLGKRCIEINPEKKALNLGTTNIRLPMDLKKMDTSILKKLESDHIEERLFAVFLISHFK